MTQPTPAQIEALQLVLLFYTIDWTPEKKAEWLRITGVPEATTKVMCDHIRSIIAAAQVGELDPAVEWVGPVKFFEEADRHLKNATIERCAQVVEDILGPSDPRTPAGYDVAAAIRKLKDAP